METKVTHTTRRQLRLGTILSAAVLTSAVCAPAWADGDPNAKPRARSVSNTRDVLVDYRVLDALAPAPGLLIPSTGALAQNDGPIVLRPPAGVAPTLVPPKSQTVIKLQPPASMRTAVEMKPLPPVHTAKVEEPAPKPVTPPVTAKPAAAKPAPAPAVAAAPPAPPAPAANVPRSILPPETKVAAVPAPVPEPVAAAPEIKTEAPAEAQVASLPPAKTVPDTLSISFGVGVPEVPNSASPDLKDLAGSLKADPALRVQLLAFASDPEKSVSRSRRLSLERAVNVRKQLLAAGIDSTRIEVRALGEQSGDGAADRVDAITSRR